VELIVHPDAKDVVGEMSMREGSCPDHRAIRDRPRGLADDVVCGRAPGNSGLWLAYGRSPNSFAPSGESIGESTVPRRTFFEGKNGTPAIVVNDRNIKPRPVFEQLHVTLHIGVDSR